MTPTHHPQLDDLVGYAAGTLTEGMDVLVACHLTFCPVCRDAVAGFEAVGAGLWGASEHPQGSLSLDELLGRLDEPSLPTPPSAVDPDEILPAPLRHRVGPYRRLGFRRYPGGVGHLPLPKLGQGVFLLDLPPSLALPAHRHDGVERALVLTGGFSAGGSAFGPGDLSEEGDHDVHEVVVDDDARCVCLFVNDGRIVPEHPWLRLVSDWIQ
jgi:putative transcriptional regulator